MLKEELKKIAVLGISSGVLLSFSQASAENSNNGGEHSYMAEHHGCGGANGCGGQNDRGSRKNQLNSGQNESAYYNSNGELTEKGLLSQLSAESKEIYQKMDNDEKQLALRLAKQYRNRNEAVRQARKSDDSKLKVVQEPSQRRSLRRHDWF